MLSSKAKNTSPWAQGTFGHTARVKIINILTDNKRQPSPADLIAT